MSKFEFWTTFIIVFLAEMPCILRTAVIQIRSGSMWSVFWGTMGGSLLAVIVGIMIGKFSSRSIPSEYTCWTQYLAGMLFIVLGLLMMVRHEH